MLPKAETIAPWALLIIAICYIWYDFSHPRVVYQREMTETMVPEYIRDIRTITVPCPESGIVVIKKKPAAERLDVPEYVKMDEAIQITASGEISPYKGITTVTAIFNTGSGETSLLSRREPRKFFALMNDKELGIRYGLSGASGMGFDLYGELTFMRLGSVELSLYGEASSTGETKAMIQTGYLF